MKTETAMKNVRETKRRSYKAYNLQSSDDIIDLQDCQVSLHWIQCIHTKDKH